MIITKFMFMILILVLILFIKIILIKISTNKLLQSSFILHSNAVHWHTFVININYYLLDQV